MTAITTRFDPWGPISTVLYEINDSDLVQNAVGSTGVDIAWRPLTRDENYSHGTRIRALRRDISRAYMNLNDDQKGQFAQIVVRAMLRRHDDAQIRSKLNDLLGDIGWTVSENGVLNTEDALISEQFFPPNSEYDAYLAIRDVLARATAEIIVVDAYVGSSLLVTLKSLAPSSLTVRVLTAEKNLRPDFPIEVARFQRQVGHIELAVRTTEGLHDRLIVIDGSEFYLVGASIKDAGKRAFMISRMRDQPIIDEVKQYVDQAWTGGKVLQ